MSTIKELSDIPKKTKNNTMAAWGFGLSIGSIFLSIIAPFSFIICIFAIIQIKKGLKMGWGWL